MRQRSAVLFVVLSASIWLAAGCGGDGESESAATTAAPATTAIPTTAAASTAVTEATTTTTTAPVTTTMAPPLPFVPGEYPLTIDVGGEPRAYLLKIPRGYDADEPLPLVIAFHGACADPESVVRGGLRWGDVAEEEGFVLVAPRGIDGEFFGQPDCPEWAVLRSDEELLLLQELEAYQPENVYEYFLDEIAEFSVGARDVDLTAALVDVLTAGLAIDEGRIFVTGGSLGGWMASRVACDLGDRIRGVAPTFHSLLISHPCSADSSVAVASIGDRDGYETLAAQALAEWADHLNCNPIPDVESQEEGFRRIRYDGCDAGAAIEMYAFDRVTRSGEEARIAWEFLASLP